MTAAQEPFPGAPSSVLTTGNLPHIVTGWLLQILRYQFADPSNITQEKLKPYVWSPDETSKITINPIYLWDPETIQRRPAVIVKRHVWKTQRISIGDAYHGHVPQDGYESTRHAVMVNGSHTMFCHAMTGLEADELGSEVGYLFLEFQQHILRNFKLHSFRMESIGEIVKIDEPHEHFMVPITVSYVMTHCWSIIQETPIWTGFSVRTEAVS